MKTIELTIYTIKEKHPNDGQQCWVKPFNSYTQTLTFNKEYECWDDAEGDDYFCDLNDNDVWVELPEL